MSQRHANPIPGGDDEGTSSARVHAPGYSLETDNDLRDMLEGMDRVEQEQQQATGKALSQRNQVAVAKAQEATKRAAQKAINAANKEREMRTKALLYQEEHLRQQSNSFDPRTESSRPERKPVFHSEKPAIRVGEFVTVQAALGIVGPARHGGNGIVMETSGTGSNTLLTVKYTIGGHVERNIDFRRATIVPGYASANRKSREKRRRDTVERFNPMHMQKKRHIEKLAKATKAVPLSIADRLQQGFSTRRLKGWRRRDLQAVYGKGKGARLSPKEKLLFRADYLQLSEYLSQGGKVLQRKKNGKFKRMRKNGRNAQYLMYAWGVGKNTVSMLKETLQVEAIIPIVKVTYGPPEDQEAGSGEKTPNSMITNIKLARENLSPKNLFINNERKRVRSENLASLDKKESTAVDSSARALWKEIEKDRDQLAIWELQSRNAIALQPTIAGKIADIMNKDPTLSWEKIASELDNWCSASTIERYVKSHPSYCAYAERLLPLLSPAQMIEHVKFANHLLNLWGKGKGKYLWIHYDEKWFWGFVARHAKMCPELGIVRQQHFVRHKSHVNKVMAVGVVGFAFVDTPENGGTAVKIAFTRAQAAKIARKMQRDYSGINSVGNPTYNGKVLRRKGDPYLVDTGVTGSNDGTADDPKFALLRYFETLVFGEIQKLVGVGGPFEGYTPVIQGDQAGPHEESEFKRRVQEHCDKNGWLWEPQAPQMPHLNVNDLALFPAMSKWHSTKIRKRTGSVASKDLIWECAAQVWEEFPECKIARAFILAWRLAKVVIKEKGKNTFLQTKKMHQQVSMDFNDAEHGVVKPRIEQGSARRGPVQTS